MAETRIVQRTWRALLSIALILTVGSCANAPPERSSPILILPAREIVTLDPARPSVGAIAIDGDRIIATGGLQELIDAHSDRSIRIDRRLEGLVVVPGLINQHEHAWLAAIVLLAKVISTEDWVLPTGRVERAKDADDYQARLAGAVEGHTEPGRVLYTWGYHQLFHGPLSRADLDRTGPDVPIIVLQRSMHEMIFNTPALERFGIDEAKIATLPDFVRAQTDLARGHFWEQGLMAVAPAVFGDLFAPERYLPALEEVERYWHEAGTTLVAEPGGLVSPALVAMQNQVLGDEHTPFRMFYIADGKTLASSFAAEEMIAETEKLFASAEGMTRFLPGRVKLFADGAIFSQLMQMRDGYLDGHHGEWIMQPELFRSAFRTYWEADYQIHVHQNGDAGLDLVLDTLEENLERHPRVDHRTVIVHFGFSRPDQVERLARLGAIVSANPFYPIVLADRYSEVGIGPERAREMVRLGDVDRAGVSLSLHADMPMAPGRPLLLMDSAVNRITLDGNLVGPEQRISAERALRAVTIDAAHSLGLEADVGSLEPGKLANMTILERNPLEVEPESIQHIGVWGTVHEGRILPVAESESRASAGRGLARHPIEK